MNVLLLGGSPSAPSSTWRLQQLVGARLAALRPVLASLAPRHILPSIYATAAQLPWDADKGVLPVAAIAARIDAGVEQLAHELEGALLRKAAGAPNFLAAAPASALATISA
jgi:FMN reductase